MELGGMGNITLEEACCSDAPRQYRCRTGIELADTSQAGRYQLVVENPILFSIAPSFLPADLHLRTMFLTLKEEAAGLSQVVLLMNNSAGVLQVAASYEIFVQPGPSVPSFRLPFRVACMDDEFPCDCPTLGTPPPALVALTVSCRTPCAFSDAERFKPTQGIYASRGQMVDGRPLFLKRATASTNAFRMYFNASDSRWYIREDAPPPPPGVIPDPEEYFRSVSFSALGRPDDATAQWEENRWDSIEQEWAWIPAPGFVVLADREPDTQCRATVVSDPAFLPTPAEELLGGTVASVNVLDSSGLDAMQRFAVGITSTEFFLKAGEAWFALDNATEELAVLQGLAEDPMADTVGLEYASQLARSPDGRLLFAAEFASDSIAVFNVETEGAARFVERRRHNETRHKLETAGETIAATSVCGMSSFTSALGNHFIAVAAGCGAMEESTSSIDLSRLILLDRPSLHPCVNQSTGPECIALASAAPEDLWEATLGWWDFTSEGAVDTLQRPRKTDEGCQEVHPTVVSPSSIRDIRGIVGSAQLMVPECKTGDWDRPASSALSMRNFLMAHGEEAAMQVDGLLNAGVTPAEDIQSLLDAGLLPDQTLSMEVWVTVNAQDMTHAGIVGAQRSGNAYARGWLLGYSVRGGVISFDFTIVVGPTHRRRQLFTVCDPSVCTVDAWLHLVASYNGTHSTLFINGKLAAAHEICTEHERNGAGNCGDIQYPLATDNPDGFGTPFVIGAYVNRQTGRVEPHIGAIKMARLYARALTQQEIEGQFRERMYLINLRVRTQFFWERTDNVTSFGAASPNITSVEVTAMAPLQIRGLFDATVRHRCAFSYSFDRKDTTTVYTNAVVVNLNSSVSVGYGLECATPTWHHGFATTTFGVDHEVALAARDPHRVFTFDYVVGTSVEVTTFGAEVRYGTIVQYDEDTGAALLDLPAVYIGGDYRERAFVEATLPDVNIYPVPPGGAAEPVWVPVWQRLCLWSECGYIPSHSRTPEERALYADVSEVIGTLTTVAFTTQSMLLQVVGTSVGDTQAEFPGLAAASSITHVSVMGQDYLLSATKAGGDSILHALDDNASPPRLSVVQRISRAGARKWARLEGTSDCFVLASLHADVAVYCWQVGLAEPLQLSANISDTTGASDVASFRIGSQAFFAVATFFDAATLSYNTTSKLFAIDVNVSWGVAMPATVIQEFQTQAATAVTYSMVADRHFLIFASAQQDIATLMVWDGASFMPYQQIPTEGGSYAMLFYQVGAVPFLLPSISAPCNTFRSGLSGRCTTAMRWNGTTFNGLATPDTLPKDTAGGQELPEGTDFAIAGDVLLSSTYQAQADVPRTQFVESGRRQTLTKNVPLRVFTTYTQTVPCLGAPVAMVVDHEHSKLYVASYHHHAISVFESDAVGELRVQESSQCVLADEPNRNDAFVPGWHQRGISGMVMTNTSAGCFGHAGYPRCLYVLNSAQSAIHVFAVEPTTALLQWAGVIRQGDPGATPPSPRIPSSIFGLTGVQALHVSLSGMHAFAAGHGDKAVAVFSRSTTDGAMTFLDVVRQGEKLFWEFGKHIPGPSPQLLADQTQPDPPTDGLSSSPTRVDPDVHSVHETVHFVFNSTHYLVAASGERGALLYAWNTASGNFTRVQEIGIESETDSNAVGVTLAYAGSEMLLIVSNWVRNDGAAYSGTRVYRWVDELASFQYNHTLLSTPPLSDSSGYRQLFRYSRATTAFMIDSETYLAAPWYGWNQGSGEIAFSMIYKWTSSAFEYYQHFAVTGAIDVEYLSPGDPLDGHHLLVFTSHFSFAGGCATTAEIAVCSGVRSSASQSVVMRWNVTRMQFEPFQELPSMGATGVHGFRLPCACKTNPTDSCMADFLVVANRQNELPESVVSLDAYDEDPSLFEWDSSRHMFIPVELGSFTTVPAPPFPDSCEDLDQYDVNLTLPYGPCYSYVEGGFNFGFCVADEVCEICQGSCATECDTPCRLSDVAAYQRRLAGLWPSREEVQGLRGATSLTHFEAGGEHFLAVAQTVCGLLQGGAECVQDQRTQPQSAVLQWRGEQNATAMAAEGLFGEMLALPPETVAPEMRDIHSWAMRIPAGGVASWNFIHVPTTTDDDVPLLLASSVTEGLVAYPWTFRRADALTAVEDIKTAPAGVDAYVVSSADDALASLHLLDPTMPDDADLPLDSRGILSTMIRFGAASVYPDGVLEGARALRLHMDADSGEVAGFNVSRGLPMSNLMCGPIRVDFEHAHEWQANEYGVRCSTVNFTISAQSDTPPESELLRSRRLSPNGTLYIEPLVRASGTVLLKASIQSTTFSQLYGEHGPTAGNEHLLWASVLKTNTAPQLVVQNVSLQASTQTVNAQFASNISTGAADEADQRLFFTFRFSNPSLFVDHPELTILDGGVANVSFQVAPGQRGTSVFVVTLQDTGGSVPLVDKVVGRDTSDPQTFFVRVAPAYIPPTFEYSVDSLVLLESPGQETRTGFVDLQSVSVSVNENGVPLPYYFALIEVRPDRGVGTVNLDNFVERPALTPDGTLSLWPVDNFYGQFWIQFAIRDANWGTCGVDINTTTCSAGSDADVSKGDLLLLIIPVNDAPSFVLTYQVFETLEVTEDREAMSHGFLTQVSAGGGDENIYQNVTLILSDFSAGCASVFATPPRIDVNGTDGDLVFNQSVGTSGACNFSITAIDDGDAVNGGVNTSAPVLAQVVIVGVNNPPTFDVVDRVVLVEGVGERSQANVAVNISTGPPDEADQQLAFLVFTDSPELFQTEPSISPDGTLTFWLMPDRFGVALLTVQAMDDGGTDNGGADRSVESKSVVLEILAQPRVTAVQPTVWLSSSVAAADTIVTVSGMHFSPKLAVASSSLPSNGTNSSSQSVAVVLGGQNCLETEVVSDEQVLCRGFEAFSAAADVNVQVRESEAVVREGSLVGAVQAVALVVCGIFEEGDGFVLVSDAATRAPLFSRSALSFDRAVRAMAVVRQGVFFGGTFQRTSGVRTNYVMGWEGGSPFALGFGMNGAVNALAEYRGSLVVVGSFTAAYRRLSSFTTATARATVVDAPGIVAWDGQDWQPVEGQNSPAGVMTAAVTWREILYVAGKFRNRLPTPDANGVARYNGSHWTPMCGAGQGCGVVGGDVLAVSSGTETCVECAEEVVLGGTFASAGSVPNSRYIARWDGSIWASVGVLDGPVNAIARINTVIYAAGSFTHADGLPVNGIAKLASDGWSQVGSGLSGTVFTLQPLSGCIYIGGDITGVGHYDSTTREWSAPDRTVDVFGQAINNLVRWCVDDFAWEAVRMLDDSAIGSPLAMTT